MQRQFVVISLLAFISVTALAQNTNSSTPARPRSTVTNTSRSPATQRSTDTQQSATPQPAARPAPAKPRVVLAQAPGADTVLAAFETLLKGIRAADVKMVSGVYWNSPSLLLFNNNGTVTKGWEQMRKNRESSYPDLKDVKLEVRDLAVMMLGRDGAVVTCQWTQSQTYKDTPETATGRMTLVFRRVGKVWKAVHLHTSPDRQDPSRVLPSEQSPSPAPSATPSPAPNQ